MKSAGLCTILLFLCVSASAGSPAPGLDFIAGSWRGLDEGTLIEEIWSLSENGQMIGMFRMIQQESPRFFELMTIEPDGDGWVLYLRHFSPGLEAWEDRNGALVFDLVSVEADRAVFDQREAETNLVYELDGPDRLTVTLEKKKDGVWKKTPFVYQRAP